MKGPRYDSALDVADIAKLLRGHIQRATALPRENPLSLPPGTAASLRIQRYSSGGRSIYARITAFPGPVMNPARVLAWELFHGGRGYQFTLHSPELLRAQYAIELMASAYNRDDSDSQSDYHSVHFSFSVDVTFQLRSPDTARILAVDHRELLEDARIALGTVGRDYVAAQLASVDLHAGAARPAFPALNRMSAEEVQAIGRDLDQLDSVRNPKPRARASKRSRAQALPPTAPIDAPPPPSAPAQPRYHVDGTRLTDCCASFSTYHEVAPHDFVLCCKTCWHEVEPGQGDGSEHCNSEAAS